MEKYWNKKSKKMVEYIDICQSAGCDYCKGCDNCRLDIDWNNKEIPVDVKISQRLEKIGYKLLDLKQFEHDLFTILAQNNNQSVVWTYNSSSNDIFWGHYHDTLKEAEKTYYKKILGRLGE